jgi:predicted RNA binding protein with dsRBD fold (UPF0201 family)
MEKEELKEMEKKILKGIKDYFFEQYNLNLLERDEDYEYSLIREALEPLYEELNSFDHSGYTYLIEDDKELVRFINEELTFKIDALSHFDPHIWAINCIHLASDGRFNSPRVDYYFGIDTEYNYYYIATGDDEPVMEWKASQEEVLEEFIQNLGPRHPNRVLKAIQKFMEKMNLDRIELLNTEIKKEKQQYLLISNKERFYDGIVDIIDEDALREVSSHKGSDHKQTIFYYEKKNKAIEVWVSFWQGSPDYEATFIDLVSEDIALLSYLGKIKKERIAVINPYTYEVIKVINDNSEVCEAKGWKFNPDKRAFENTNGEQTCPPPEVNNYYYYY